MAAFGVEIVGDSIGQMGVPGIQVYVTEEMMLHVVTVRVWVRRWKANVFVQVECAAQREVQFLFFVQAHKFAIDAFHCLPGGKTQNKMWISAQLMSNDARDQ